MGDTVIPGREWSLTEKHKGKKPRFSSKAQTHLVLHKRCVLEEMAFKVVSTFESYLSDPLPVAGLGLVCYSLVMGGRFGVLGA